MLIDLHCHTYPRSQCSALSPDELIERARAKGFDAVCFTEHDAFWPENELRELAAATMFPVFSGVEFTTDMGHVLAFGLSGSPGNYASAADLAQKAKAEGALLFLAHPARDGHLRVDRRAVEFFESVEAINGSDSRLQNMAASGLARGFRLGGIGGSDAHTLAETGRAGTRFDAQVGSNQELVEALRSGRYSAGAL